MGKKKSFVKAPVPFQDLKRPLSKQGVPLLGDAMDAEALNRCCGIDCCEDVIYLTDKATGVKRVLYSKNGVTVNATQAAYDADKAAGFV